MDEPSQHAAAEKRLSVMALILFLLASCQEQSVPAPEQGPIRIPEQICAQAQQGVEQAEEAGVIVNDGATAMVEQRIWYAFGAAAQDAIIKALAVRASCLAEAPLAEVDVTIMNEVGTSLERQLVDLSAQDLTSVWTQ